MLTRRKFIGTGLAAMAGGFNNQVVGGLTKLIRDAINSPNYVPGVSGWTINKDGTAEFNDATFRGSLIVESGSSGEALLVYNGPPANGNLYASISTVTGVDPYGNTYGAGVGVYVLTGVGSPTAVFSLFGSNVTSFGGSGIEYDDQGQLGIIHSPGPASSAPVMVISYGVNSNGIAIGTSFPGKYYAEEVSLNSQVLANSAVTTLTNFTDLIVTTDYNAGGTAFNLVNGQWFCPETGWYSFTYSIGLTTWVAGSRLFMEMTKGISRFAAYDGTPNDAKCATINATKFFVKGDTASFIALQTSGASRTIDNTLEASYITIRRCI